MMLSPSNSPTAVCVTVRPFLPSRRQLKILMTVVKAALASFTTHKDLEYFKNALKDKDISRCHLAVLQSYDSIQAAADWLERDQADVESVSHLSRHGRRPGREVAQFAPCRSRGNDVMYTDYSGSRRTSSFSSLVQWYLSRTVTRRPVGQKGNRRSIKQNTTQNQGDLDAMHGYGLCFVVLDDWIVKY